MTCLTAVNSISWQVLFSFSQCVFPGADGGDGAAVDEQVGAGVKSACSTRRKAAASAISSEVRVRSAAEASIIRR